MTTTATRTAPSLADLAPEDREVIALVLDHRAEHGAGPTWRELRVALGMDASISPTCEEWRAVRLRARADGTGAMKALRALRAEGVIPPEDPPRKELTAKLHRLRKGGWLTYTSRERSLDAGETTWAAFQAAQTSQPIPLAEERRSQ